MYHVNEIRELLKMIDRSSIGELTIKTKNEGSITIKKSNGEAVAHEAPVRTVEVESKTVNTPKKMVETNETKKTSEINAEQQVAATKERQVEQNINDQDLYKVTSPMVGIFYTSPSPDAAPYVQAGDQVEENTVVCIVEAMKLFNEIEAEVKGEIVEVLVKNGDLVEYGQPLFLVKK